MGPSALPYQRLADMSLGKVERTADMIVEMRERQKWATIRMLAEKDAYIKEQLDKIDVYYRLKYEQRRR